MKANNEYKGGHYVIFEFIGLYVRYLFFKITGGKRSIKYLSGEQNFPIISKKQRIFCLIVGVFCTISLICIVFLFISRPIG